MPLGIPLVWSDRCLLHEPEGALWIGLPEPGDEIPARLEAIRDALVEAGAELVPAEPHADDTVTAVHDEGLVVHLRDAWRLWHEAGFVEERGQRSVVPYIFPHPGFVGPEPSPPAAISARAGTYAYDTMTPIGEHTWPAVRAAVDVALTAADLVLSGAPAAYGCTRPPGHHATRSAFGGSCYLNNAAIAAQYLRDRGAAAVAVVDLDAHQGNGTHAIFAGREDVRTGSVHVDPRAGWFPHFVSEEGEVGVGTLDLPLPEGAADDRWLAAVAQLAEWASTAEAVVVALGVDAAAGDPTAPLQVSEDAFRAAGRLFGSLALPTVLVQEGGYDLAAVGGLVLAALEGVEEGRTS